MSDNQYADLAEDGDSEWVSLRGGSMVSVDCVDSNGVSTAWGGATVALLYSPDARMRCAANDVNGDITGTDGFCRNMDGVYGFVAIAVSSYGGGTFRICATKTRNQNV